MIGTQEGLEMGSGEFGSGSGHEAEATAISIEGSVCGIVRRTGHGEEYSEGPEIPSWVYIGVVPPSYTPSPAAWAVWHAQRLEQGIST